MLFRKEPDTHSTPHLCTPHLEQVRRLSLFLASSVAVNVVLVAVLAYSMSGGFLLSRCQVSGRFWDSSKEHLAGDRTNAEVLRSLAHMLPEQLVSLLGDSQKLEEGLTVRDLVLGCLTSLHHFDLAKALHGHKLPKERIFEIDQMRVAVYPGLGDSEFLQAIAFVNNERWPLTAHGLFLALAQPKLRQDPSLAEAFFLTQEFLTLQRLFARAEGVVERGEILELVLEGDWSLTESFYQAAMQVNESSPTLRRRMLLTYIQRGSRLATVLMLRTDGAYSANRFDEAAILAMLKTIDVVTPEVETFVAELVHSPHSEEVLQCAHCLCSKALAAAVKEIEDKQVTQPRKEKIYVVQRGDSLWKISKQLKVSVQSLKSHNGLDSDNLKPGATLRIP